jgi:hypothetical protein
MRDISDEETERKTGESQAQTYQAGIAKCHGSGTNLDLLCGPRSTGYQPARKQLENLLRQQVLADNLTVVAEALVVYRLSGDPRHEITLGQNRVSSAERTCWCARQVWARRKRMDQVG